MSHLFELPVFDIDSLQKDQSGFTKGLFSVTDLFVNSIYRAGHIKKVREYMLHDNSEEPLLLNYHQLQYGEKLLVKNDTEGYKTDIKKINR